MPGGARNGRTLKLALLVGLVLLTLYFFVSWRMEVAAMAQYASSAEGEYQSLKKRFNRLETELKDSIVRESRLDDVLQRERQSHSKTNEAKLDLEAKCMKETEAKKSEVNTLKGEKAELQEQIQAVKADSDAKSQEAQRLKDELREAKENADNEYQALSATCVQNQQTCEKRAKLAEDELSRVRKEADTAQQSSQDCHSQLTVQQELARSCNVRVSTLEKEGAGRLSEIEQLQAQLHLAQADNTKLVAQLRELQNSLAAYSKPAQQAAGQREEPHHNIAKRYDGGNVEVNNKIDDLHRLNVAEGNQFQVKDIRNGNQRDDVQRANNWNGNQFHIDNHRNGDELQKANFEDRNQFHMDGIGNGNQRYGVHDGERFGDEQHGGEHDRLGLNSHKKTGDLGGAEENFNDFRISDDQKISVFESLQGKVARGETLDERQQKILQLLLQDFDRIMNRNQNAPVQNGIGMEHHQQQQQEPAEDDDVVRADGGKQQQLPNPLDDGEEVKDLLEEHQKSDEFDNLGGPGERKPKVIDREREQDEAAGAGGEELKQPKDGHEGRDDVEVDHQYLHEDVEEHKGKVDNKVGDDPLPQPGQEEENPDDEDSYAAKKGKHEGDEDDDVYGDHAYKQDRELFKQERQQRIQERNFDRQL